MALTLIVEDGTGVVGANSLATLDQIKDYNAVRGVVLPATDDGIIALAVQAMDYLGTYEPLLSGLRTIADQYLPWPRAGVWIDRTLHKSNVVPRAIIEVQCYVAGLAASIDLYGNQDGRAISKEVIGPIETDYSTKDGATYGPILPTVTAKMKPYMRSGAGMLKSVRV